MPREIREMRGIEILAGTDVPLVGFSLLDELDLLVQSGLTPAEALRAATINPARFLHDEAANGSVSAGKNADLVLLDANPLESIKNTQRISAVVVRGRYLDRAELDGMLAAVEKTANLLSISSALMPVLQKDGVDAALDRYRDLKAHHASEYEFGEDELNRLGYALLRMKKIDEAVKILELNVEVNPRSANAYDSLGEACAAQGNREKAIAVSCRPFRFVHGQNVSSCLRISACASNSAHSASSRTHGSTLYRMWSHDGSRHA